MLMEKTIKKIAFFTVGFAFNRLVRMRFYEKTFPKHVQIYLITTDKYEARDSSMPQQEYDLSRTKIVKIHYDWRLISNIRRFCKDNKIDRLMNLGFHTSVPFLFLARALTKTDFCINVLVDIFKQHYLANKLYDKVRDFFALAMLFLLVRPSKKVYFTDPLNASRAPKFFIANSRKFVFLAAPVDTKLFMPKDKNAARKKLKFGVGDKLILYVGRANYLRCSDILHRLVEKNKNWKFILIGPIVDPKIKKLQTKNLVNIEKLSQEQLVDYYAAADFVFCLNRGGGGIGLSSEEAMACGKPIVISKQFKVDECVGVYQIGIDSAQAQQAIENYFRLPIKKKEDLSKEVRKYTYERYSFDAWKADYLKAYLT